MRERDGLPAAFATASIGTGGHPRGQGRLVPLVSWQVVAAALELIRQVLLLDVRAFEVLAVAIPDPDSVLLHAPVRGVSQMQGHRQRALASTSETAAQ